MSYSMRVKRIRSRRTPVETQNSNPKNIEKLGTLLAYCVVLVRRSMRPIVVGFLAVTRVRINQPSPSHEFFQGT